jgi:hypothetical protein
MAKTHTTNYFNTFIQVAEDCPITNAEVPSRRGDQHTIATIQYEMIAKNPYRYTSDDVVFGVFARRQNISEDDLETEQEKFFSKGQACLRSSPLAKRYGFGLHHDAEGKIALYPRESAEYEAFAQDKALKQFKAMRSKRA